MSDDLPLFQFSDSEKSKPAKAASQERMEFLCAELNRHNRLYYEEAAPEISDAEYDALYRELESLELTHPEWANANSPTRRVGGAPLKSFESVEHLVPMLSIDDVFELSPEQLANRPGTHRAVELVEFYQRLIKLTGEPAPWVSVEPKIDGVAITLIYREGELAYAATRGDGKRGDLVTENIRTIQGIPLQLGPKAPTLLEVRGEVFMRNADFAKLNEERDEAGLPNFANPRNATAGTLKQLDSREVAKRPLSFLAHGLGAYDGPELATEADFHHLLDAFQIPRNQPVTLAKSQQEMLDAIEELNHLRHGFAHATDGAVVKLFDRQRRAELGTTSRAPRWAAAYKFLPEQAETQLLAITIQVGRTGVLTPVAELKPVLVSGTTVSRATLHNQDEIDRKDIRIGDTVIIEKAGEIIPAVVKVLTEHRDPLSSKFSIFDHVGGKCPSCHGDISQEQGFVAWRCTNFNCPAQAVTSIILFASRKALDIESLGGSVAEALVANPHGNHPKVEGVMDLFSLSLKDFAQLNLGTAENPRLFGEKRAQKVIDALEAAKSRPLSRWLYALGIRHIGDSAANEVARLHESIFDLAESPILRELVDDTRNDAKKKNETLAQYAISSELGRVAAQSLLDFFASPAGQTVLQRLEALGLHILSDNYAPTPNEAKSGLPFSGQVFVITGTLSGPRDLFKKRIESLGGKVSGSISKQTDYLLAGDAAGSKLAKAESLGVRVLSEEDFESLCSETPNP